MLIESLTNHELTSSLDRLAARERENTVELLRYLIEFESRALFRELGYSSIFDYCIRRLKMSEGAACRRIKAARCLRENPEVAEHLRNGDVTICTLAAASVTIQNKVTAVTEIIGRSKKEVEHIIAAATPVQTKPREVVKPVMVQAPADLIEAAPKREERVKVEFSMTKEDYEKFEALQAELSMEEGRQLTIEQVMAKLIAKRQPKRPTKRIRVRTSKTRYIPKAVKQQVFARDGGQCTFVSAVGVRCCEKKFLHFDHIRPFAKGGLTETPNLRLLCPAHNRLMAERQFGKDFIASKIVGGPIGTPDRLSAP